MALPIPAGTYGVDPAHTQVGFSVTHLGISMVRGFFDDFDGSLTVADTVADSSLVIEVEMASVSSTNADRDRHVRGENFFDVSNHPQMTFRSTSITWSDSGYVVTGDLTIKGITESVTLEATYNGSAVFPVDGSTHHGFSARAAISRSAFGISFGVPMVTDEVDLFLEAQFVSPAPD